MMHLSRLPHAQPFLCPRSFTPCLLLVSLWLSTMTASVISSHLTASVSSVFDPSWQHNASLVASGHNNNSKSQSQVVNCTNCDSPSQTIPTKPHLTPRHNASRPSSIELLKYRSSSSSFYPHYTRSIRSAVIETTIAPAMNMVALQDDDSNHDSSLSSTPVTTLSPKSTAVPSLGFGDFHLPDSPSENYDDDEDFVPAESNKDAEDSKVANMNVAFPSESNHGREHDIHVAFGDSKGVPTEANSFEEADDFDDVHDDFGHFDDHDSHPKKGERILIMGNQPPPFPADGIFTMQQAIPDGYEGCFCDRRYRVIQNADFGDSERRENANSSASGHDEATASGIVPGTEEVTCYCAGASIALVPKNFSLNVKYILFKGIGLEVLQADALQRYANLSYIFMSNMRKLHMIEAGAFCHLPHLMTIYIQMAPALKFIPDGVFMCAIPKLIHLKVIHSGLEQLPTLDQDKSNRIISMIDFDNSRIRNLTTRSVNVNAESLNIEYNQIEFVAGLAFSGSQIAKLSLKGNRKLVYLEESAFLGLKSLRELDLSQTSITRLPTTGLSESLEVLRIMDTFTMKEIPFVYNFQRMKEAHLTYPYHCCAFSFPANHNPAEYARIKRLLNTDRMCKGHKVAQGDKSSRARREASTNWINFTRIVEYISDLVKSNLDLNWSSETNQHNVKRRHLRNSFGDFLHANDSEQNDTKVFGVMVYENNNSRNSDSPYEMFESSLEKSTGHKHSSHPHSDSDQYGHPANVPPQTDTELPGTFGTPRTSISSTQEFCGDISSQMPVVRCYPTPDAFNPCEDIMGNNFLRSLVWLVVIAAVVGNLAVVIVLVSGRFGFNVSKFLMINLAIADLMMGVYLLIIAVMDIRTMGVYFNYAIDWQHGLGCKVAGFITVFAAALSIFTLTLITLERWFAITYAIQLNRRLKLSQAIKVMFFGWLYAILMASLPLMGVSSYSKTSICLPMEHRNLSDNMYLISLLSVNVLAFILITACYGKMYISIISQKTRATINDMTIAKRMALLIFTDFACWAPIAFFGLTAISGYPLIDVTRSKFLLVTFYPLNSCANPFLYAILTKQYRRDFFILVSRYGLCTKQAMRYKNATRQHMNYYLKHHHHHHRANLPHESSEIAPRANHFAKSTPASGSIFSQLSCDGQNVHLYKYICKGHHHHHYCAAYHQSHSQQSQSQTGNNASSASQAQHSHHSCSEAEPSSNDHEEQREQACCSKYGSQECIDSKSGSVASLTGEKNKHRKHKRCHHMHQHHRLRCRCQRSHRSCHHHSRCQHRKCAAIHSHKNDPSSCCHSAVFSTVNIYPELSSTDKHDKHRGGDYCEQCDCRPELNSNSNENALAKGSKKSSSNNAEEREGNHHREKGSSSCEQVHIMRRSSSKDGPLNGRVIYTRNKSTPGDVRNSTSSKMTSAKFKHKRSLPFVSLLERISFAKIGRLRTKTKPNGIHCTEVECSETSSPYSSSTSSSTRRRHYHHPCHHHRCCHPAQQLSVANEDDADHEPDSTVNRLPMEEQREILRQALQESTTVQDAVAAVEELSSGARVSSMGSSSSSKKNTKAIEHKENSF